MIVERIERGTLRLFLVVYDLAVAGFKFTLLSSRRCFAATGSLVAHSSPSRTHMFSIVTEGMVRRAGSNYGWAKHIGLDI